jgi:hypothetical protein
MYIVSEDLIKNISSADLIIKQIVWQNQSHKLAYMVYTSPVLAVLYIVNVEYWNIFLCTLFPVSSHLSFRLLKGRPQDVSIFITSIFPHD